MKNERVSDECRIGFLFNHDQIHQVAHSASIAFELSILNPAWQVTLIFCTPADARMIAKVAQHFPGHRCILESLTTSGFSGWLSDRIDSLAPLRKVSILGSNLEFFRGFDALVVPEKTSLLLRTRYGLDSLKLIHTRHGAGDRAVGFDAHSDRFDFVLLAGDKIRRRLIAAGHLKSGACAIVGYPKFDAVGAFTRTPKRYFDNDRPTVLYNPHCSPHLSSWYGMGMEVLEYFHHSDKYNLIIAPHVMLYRRRLQIAIDKFSFAWARSIPRKYRECPHMLIDTGSEACCDMSYTLAADLYLGDVSSQVCEFLVRPRPCVFANPRGIDWFNDPNYAAWHLGPVFQRIGDLDATLQLAIESHADFALPQKQYFDATFDLSDEPSSQRAAAAIAGFMSRPSTVTIAEADHRLDGARPVAEWQALANT